VTRAYFRELSPPNAPDAPPAARALPAPGGPADRTADLEQMLAELEIDDLPRDARPVLLLEGKGHAAAGATTFKTALAALHARAPHLHAQRMEELAYLTNVLVSGGDAGGRSFRPLEAAVAVADVCNVGLEHLLEGARAREKEKATTAERALEWLSREGAEKAFRVGWWLLHHDA
jgi:hypothetical protein